MPNEPQYSTTLSAADEERFQQWVKTNKIPWVDEPKADYDMRGFWKAQQAGDPRAVRSKETRHFPDTWKTPYHETFSNESIYATPDAPHWEGNKLVPTHPQQIPLKGELAKDVWHMAGVSGYQVPTPQTSSRGAPTPIQPAYPPGATIHTNIPDAFIYKYDPGPGGQPPDWQPIQDPRSAWGYNTVLTAQAGGTVPEPTPKADLSTKEGILASLDQRIAAQEAATPEYADILGQGEGVEEARAEAARAGIPPELSTKQGILDSLAAHAQKQEAGAQALPWWEHWAIAAATTPGIADIVETGLGREFAQPFIRTPFNIIGGTWAGAAGALRELGGGTRLDGKPLEEVQAERDRIAVEQANIQRLMDSQIQRGVPMNSDALISLGAQNADLERMKQENNAVLASGQVKPGPVATPGFAGQLRGLATRGANYIAEQLRESARTGETERTVQAILPTTQELDQSLPGQIASGLGTAGALTTLGFLGAEVEIPSIALMGAGQQYEDAVAKGADEKTAENAALLSALASPIQSLSFLPGAALARKLRGLTARQAITELSKAAGYGAVGSGAYQVTQNLVSVLTGYDPNRRLDEGVYRQLALGAVVGGTLGALGVIPGYARYLRGADVRVRDRPGTPVETGQVPPAPEAGAGAPVTPIAPAPTEPLEAAAARTTAAMTPEQVLAAQGTPEQALTEHLNVLAGTQPAPAVPAPTETVTPVAAPAPAETVSGRVEQKLEQGRQVGGRQFRSDFEDRTLLTPEEANQLLELQAKFEADPSHEMSADEKALVDSIADRTMLTDAEKAEINRGSKADVSDFLSTWRKTVERYSRAVERGEPPAAIRGAEPVGPAAPLAIDLPVERANPQLLERPTQAEVKETTNTASARTGLDQVVHYVPNVDALPARVKKALTEGQRTSTAQTVWDNSMHELWVIGDRFDSHADLQRALIEETQGRIWRDIADVNFKHDPSDPRLGHYDIGRDQVILNTNALMRTNDPFGQAQKVAAEEIVAHKGISRLYGSRESAAYVNAMNRLQRNFDQAKMNDVLAQQKGFKNLDEMAKAYGFEDYESNPQHQHALTEELAGAYMQRFGSREELEADAPRWYQAAMQTLLNGVRRRFGMEVSPLEMQQLLADSMGALRKPKIVQDSQYHPETGEQAKAAMFNYQFAALRGDQDAQADWFKQWTDAGIDLSNQAVREQIAEKAAGVPEPGPTGEARIGDIFVRAEQAATRAGMGPGQEMRAQPERLAQASGTPFSERMSLAKAATAVYDTRGLQTVMAQARGIFQNEYGGDIHAAMQDMVDRPVDDSHPAMRRVINDETNRQIQNLKDRGLTQTAWSLERYRDKFNQLMAPLVTKLAQALNAQKLMYEDGPAAIGRLRAAVQGAQARFFRDNAGARDAYSQIQQVAERTVNNLLAKYSPQIDSIQTRMDKLFGLDPQSLANRYINALATTLNTRFAGLGFVPEDRPILQDLFNRFQSTISQKIRDGMEPVPTPEAAERMGPTATIREAIGNQPMFQRAWDETVSRLQTENPNALFFSKLAGALDSPFSRDQVRGVIREQGQDLRKLIFNHYTTQERIGNELANALTQGLGIEPSHALEVQNAFDAHYRELLQQTAGKELQGVLDRVGSRAGRTPAKGELDRLTDLMAIGGLDKEEYHNLLAPRFGLGAWNPDTIAKLKVAGTVLQQLRDEGGPEVFKNQTAAKIADLIAQSQDSKQIGIRQAEALWMASLLTGPFTHGRYYVQNMMQPMVNLLFRTVLRPHPDPQTFFLAVGDMFNGMVHSARTEFPFIWSTGIHTQRELPGGEVAGFRAEGIPARSALESTPLPGEMRNPLNWYRYVGRFLHGAETVFYRGANNAITRALAMRLADERGMSSEDAIRWSEQIVYGTENDRADSVEQANREQTRFGFGDDIRDQRIEELVNEKRFARAPELADEAHRFALHSIYREAPYGMLGNFARTLNAIRKDHPSITPITPFINLPANVAQEFMNWTPIGIWRGRDAFGAGTEAIQKLYADVPGFKRLVEDKAISDRELRDLAYEYMGKGVIGTLGILSGMGYALTNRNNPNPALDFTGAGPDNKAEADALRAGGWQPYSIKVGNLYFGYQASPWASALGIIGGASDLIHYGKDLTPENLSTHLAFAALKDGFSAITDASFLQGLQTVLAIGGGQTRQSENKIENFLAAQASTAVGIFYGGTGTRQIYTLLNPNRYEAHNLGEVMVRNIPVLNDALLRPRLNVLGEPVQVSALQRILPSVQSADPVWRWINDNNVKISYPTAKAKVDGVQMDAAELHEFIATRGKELRSSIEEDLKAGTFEGMDQEDRDAAVKELEREADAVAAGPIREKREAAGK